MLRKIVNVKSKQISYNANEKRKYFSIHYNNTDMYEQAA